MHEVEMANGPRPRPGLAAPACGGPIVAGPAPLLSRPMAPGYVRRLSWPEKSDGTKWECGIDLDVVLEACPSFRQSYNVSSQQFQKKLRRLWPAGEEQRIKILLNSPEFILKPTAMNRCYKKMPCPAPRPPKIMGSVKAMPVLSDSNLSSLSNSMVSTSANSSRSSTIGDDSTTLTTPPTPSLDEEAVTVALYEKLSKLAILK
eukprot:TRINITY_DN2219_c0_g1_i1.p1 TRINITY_DN2219_c0_g1~~TRINITY_DN2219_c0_g1_i1.p1  ORF type:complete len:203 (+),score=24.23 TRINITY_DN2219_c0_g1_i1:52-660(+)